MVLTPDTRRTWICRGNKRLFFGKNTIDQVSIEIKVSRSRSFLDKLLKILKQPLLIMNASSSIDHGLCRIVFSHDPIQKLCNFIKIMHPLSRGAVPVKYPEIFAVLRAP